MPDQNQSDPNKNPVSPPVFSPTADLPPIPPAFQNVPADNPSANSAGLPAEAAAQAGSAAPPGTPPVVSMPKKKFGGGKIIATILGIFLLIGGIGAGILLIQQPQLFQQKAAGRIDCGSVSCNADTQVCCNSGCKPKNTGCAAGDEPQGQIPTVPPGVPTTSTREECESNTTFCKDGCYKPTYNSVNHACTCERDPNLCNDTSTTSYTCKNSANLCEYYSCSEKIDCAQKKLVAGYCITNATGACPATESCVANGIACKVNASTKVGNCCSGLHCDSSGRCVTGVATGPETGPIDVNTITIGNIKCGSKKQSCDFNQCHCTGGDECGDQECLSTDSKTSPYNLISVCEGSGRAWCVNVTGNGMTCCVAGYKCNSGGNGCVPKGTTASNPPSGSNPPAGSTAQCIAVKAYSGANWGLLNAEGYSHLRADDVVNFCVTGSATAGTFDRAQFKINATLKPETTTKRPGSEDYCQAYTIQDGDINVPFTVKAKIHHATLNAWYGETI